MSRRTIILIASLLTMVAAILPLAAIAIYARHRAMEGEKAHVAEYAGWTLQRAERNLDLAKGAIAALEREDWQACSPDHITSMRRLTLNVRSVDEIGYFIDGRLACTSWGQVEDDIRIGHPDAQLPGGYGLYLNLRPRLTGGEPMNALVHGHYNVLMNPERLVDVLTDSQMTLGIAAADGKLLSMVGPADRRLVGQLAMARGSGRSGDRIFASVEGDGLRAFAIADHEVIGERIDRELWILVPVGLVMSMILVGLILWASRLRLSPQTELAIAIRRREFVAFYQPLMELSTGLCVGAEALVRWQRPDGAWIAPDHFIPLAEQTGLIEPLTDLMIERVVTDLAQMLRNEKLIHIAINIAASDMQSGRFLPILSRRLADADVPPSKIWLEATERGFMDAASARATIERARQAGHMVAIDDFGTGYSSLSLLETLPLDALKIDKSFISAIGTQAATSVVTPHIIDMAHGLKFHVVAEGVETQEQEAYLKAAGVEFAQGWLYSKALPASEFASFFRRANADRVPSFLEQRSDSVAQMASSI